MIVENLAQAVAHKFNKYMRDQVQEQQTNKLEFYKLKIFKRILFRILMRNQISKN